MSPKEVREILTDFFTPGKFLNVEQIPDIMEWKKDFFDKMQENCGACSSNKSKLEYSHKIKKILYGR